MAVRINLNISLDGIAAPAGPTPENPMGEDWGRLVEVYTGTRTFRERVLNDALGEGTTGIDDQYAGAYLDGVGAEILGAGVFVLHSFPDDPNWRGWWGDDPPFHAPVIVLTHRERPAIDFANGTRFEFLAVTPEEALSRALKYADGRDIRVGRGVSVAQDFLRADLGYAVASELAKSGVNHVTFTR